MARLQESRSIDTVKFNILSLRRLHHVGAWAPKRTSRVIIQCAAHRPPRVGVVMQRVVMHDSSFGGLIRIRFCKNHVKSSRSRGRNWPGMLRRPSEDRKFQKFVEVWPETDRRIREKCNLDGRRTQKCAKSVPQDRPLQHPRPPRNSSAGDAAGFPLGVLALWSCRNERPA